jgi:hypothetical protein
MSTFAYRRTSQAARLDLGRRILMYSSARKADSLISSSTTAYTNSEAVKTATVLEPGRKRYDNYYIAGVRSERGWKHQLIGSRNQPCRLICRRERGGIGHHTAFDNTHDLSLEDQILYQRGGSVGLD